MFDFVWLTWVYILREWLRWSQSSGTVTIGTRLEVLRNSVRFANSEYSPKVGLHYFHWTQSYN
jgi:hypothetical protein